MLKKPGEELHAPSMTHLVLFYLSFYALLHQPDVAEPGTASTL